MLEQEALMLVFEAAEVQSRLLNVDTLQLLPNGSFSTLKPFQGWVRQQSSNSVEKMLNRFWMAIFPCGKEGAAWKGIQKWQAKKELSIHCCFTVYLPLSML